MGKGVRISGGRYRGHRLAVPRAARPTEGRVREALFSIWQDRLTGARLLDLFAGSGSVSVEAISRGALWSLAVEGDLQAIRTLARNRTMLPPGSLQIKRLRLPGGLAALVEEGLGPFDLVFADPPYRFSGYRGLVEAVEPLLAPDASVAIEHSARFDLPAEVGRSVLTDRRRYGESALSFYSKVS